MLPVKFSVASNCLIHTFNSNLQIQMQIQKIIPMSQNIAKTLLLGISPSKTPFLHQHIDEYQKA